MACVSHRSIALPFVCVFDCEMNSEKVLTNHSRMYWLMKRLLKVGPKSQKGHERKREPSVELGTRQVGVRHNRGKKRRRRGKEGKVVSRSLLMKVKV